ncbi:hypothetical protein D3C78_1296260 [compost metagenome]
MPKPKYEVVIDDLVTLKHANRIFVRQKNRPNFRILLYIRFIVIMGGEQLPEKILLRFLLLRLPTPLLQYITTNDGRRFLYNILCVSFN